MNIELKKKQAGFTLIEILVVFSVVAILAGIGLTSLVSYSQARQVSQAALNFKLLINQARANALSAVKTNTNTSGQTITCGSEVLLGYSISALSNLLRLSQNCTNTTSQTVKQVVLPANVVYFAGTTCSTFGFNALSSKTYGLPCNIVLNGYSQTKTIQIDEIGNVSVN